MLVGAVGLQLADFHLSRMMEVSVMLKRMKHDDYLADVGIANRSTLMPFLSVLHLEDPKKQFEVQHLASAALVLMWM